MKRFNRMREEWKKLYWDEVPRALDHDPVAKRPIDHYQVWDSESILFYIIFCLFEQEMDRRYLVHKNTNGWYVLLF